MNCPRCQKEIPRDASSCQACGFSFDDATQRFESPTTPSGKPSDKRYGLLALISTLFFHSLGVFFPMTTELTAWYATDFTIALVIGIALAAYGFYISLAGQPVFKGGLLED